MRNNRTQRRTRSLKPLKRFFKFIFAVTCIFFVSFVLTLAMKSSNPVAYVLSYGYDVLDFFISDDKPAEKIDTKPAEKKSVEQKNISVAENSIGEKIDRIMSVKSAVNEKISAKKNYVKISDIPDTLKNAIVAVEDSRFYEHGGIDIGGISRAAIVNFEAGEIEEGGSTITQQLVKNLFLNQEQSYARKAEEILLAMNLEKNFSKDEIIEMYLNTIYFGSNFYGIYDAAHGYFGKDPKDLSLAESAMLAGLPNAPSVYSPYVNFMLAKKRQHIVIDAMLKNNFINNKDAENARIEEIILSKNQSHAKKN